MAYTPKTWECGETITAEKLNHIEDGIADASSGGGTTPLILEVVSTREATAEECEDGGGVVYTYNHTWQEVHDALLQGTMVFYHTNNDMGFEEYGIVRSVGFNATTNEYVVDDLVASAPTDVLKAVECGRQ